MKLLGWAPIQYDCCSHKEKIWDTLSDTKCTRSQRNDPAKRQQESGHFKARREAFEESNPANILILNFLLPEL